MPKNESIKPELAEADAAKIRIEPKRAFAMVASYARSKIVEQLKAVVFIVVYLVAVQTLVLKAPIQDAIGAGLGIGATVLGLALFLEGLFLGIMPLGEQCGLKLPGRAGVLAIAAFSAMVGVAATLAEPAIGLLKAQGGAALPWESPLLYFFLNRGSGLLVAAVAAGVGVAVVLGVFRFLYGWSLKPFLFAIIPALVGLSFYFEFIPVLRPVAGLAWDTGGVTTGPVTVPLVIALGIGVSRIAGRGRGGATSLGVVTLASALPVLAVFGLALALGPKAPTPAGAPAFFSPFPEARAKALFVTGGEAELAAAAARATALGFLDPAFAAWALSPERGTTADSAVGQAEGGTVESPKSAAAPSGLVTQLRAAVTAVLPLMLLLALTLVVFLRERIRAPDEIALGLAFSILGLFLFNAGMERGLSALGGQAGAALPRAYEATAREDSALALGRLSESDFFTVVGPEGPKRYLWLDYGRGPSAVPEAALSRDAVSGDYRYVPIESAVFAAWGRYAGMAAVLAFVFALGLGATLAEPSLAALGHTVEDLTTGTYRKTTLVRNVGIGVGIGLAAGFARILFSFQLSWILGPAYALALVLTAFSSEEFSGIAWDSAGVTTGPVTVPLVIATGLGLGAGGGSGFGAVAAASVFPIVFVLASGLAVQARAKRAVAKGALV